VGVFKYLIFNYALPLHVLGWTVKICIECQSIALYLDKFCLFQLLTQKITEVKLPERETCV